MLSVFSYIQVALTVFSFGVSFYSSTVKCWDKVGLWVHFLVHVLNHLAIPVIVTIVGLPNYFDADKKNSPYTMIMITYAVSQLVDMVKFWFDQCRNVSKTYQWHKARQGGNNQIWSQRRLEQSKEKRKLIKSKKDLPFKDIIVGDGEGERNLGNQLTLGGDVYSVMFASLLKAEYSDFAEHGISHGPAKAKKGKKGKALGAGNASTNRSQRAMIVQYEDKGSDAEGENKDGTPADIQTIVINDGPMAGSNRRLGRGSTVDLDRAIKLGLQEGAKQTQFLQELEEFGMSDIRWKNDLVTHRDMKSVLFVWVLQMAIISYVVFSSDAAFFPGQLDPSYIVTQLATSIVMHLLL